MANQPLILIADDDAAFREIFSTKLSAEGYRIETAEDGKIAVQKTQALKPDLVLMDVNMPVMDGAAATLAIRAIPEIKDTKIAFLTSLGDPQLEVQNFNSNISKNFGAQGYLRKTDDLDSLAAQIKQFLL
ncbi:MAG TPA: response regulator transcription factor [Candidatus Paceibacterota bacterium]|nr:response regulator transcription factor [Candidatus Paceibacterota bacterium]